MNPQELFEQIKDLVAKKDFSAAQKFIDEHKDDLGDYLEQAKGLVAGIGGVDGAIDKIKGLFGK